MYTMFTIVDQLYNNQLFMIITGEMELVYVNITVVKQCISTKFLQCFFTFFSLAQGKALQCDAYII